MWRVLVVEDDPQMREFFSLSVLRCAGLLLAASIGNVTEAKAWLDDNVNNLDVLLIDLGLPDGSGLDVIRHAVKRHPRCEPLVISMFGDEENVLASIESGALGYIHKDCAQGDIGQIILKMKAGASPISPMIARLVLTKYQLQNQQLSNTQTAPGQVVDAITELGTEVLAGVKLVSQRGLLSPREQDVLALIARGFSYDEIARLQNLSVHTVQTHIKNLYNKLSVHSKNEAVFEATRMGLLTALD